MMRALTTEHAQITADRLALVSLITSIAVACATYFVILVLTHA